MVAWESEIEEALVLSPLKQLVRRTERRLRAGRALRDGATVTTWTFVAASIAILVIEVGWGLRPGMLWVLAPAALIPVGAALRGLALGHGVVRSAKALDRGATNHDRIGTALAFEGRTGGLIEAQRADAVARAEALVPARAVPFGAGVPLRGALISTAILALVLVGCLKLDLHWTMPAPEPTALEEAGEDLLANLAEIEEEAIARGDKRLVHAVTDLRDEVEAIVDEERRRKEQLGEDEPEEEPPTPEAPPPTPEEQPQLDSSVYTVAELEAMHDQLQAELAAVMDFDLDTARRAAREAMRGSNDPLKPIGNKVSNDMLPEFDMQERGQMQDGGFDEVFGASHNPLHNQDNAMSMDVLKGQMDEMMATKRDEKTPERMIADERRTALAESFRNFCDEYVAERGEQMADWLAGNRDRGPKVKVAAEDAVPDKTDAMAELGFEDVTEEEDGSGELDSSLAPRREVDEIPEGADVKLRDDPGKGMAEGMPGGEGDGQTTRGALGAGKGGDSRGAERETAQDLPRQGGMQLEQILGNVTDDRLPPEQRREILDEVASHKIGGGFANDFEDDHGNYFEEAERLLIEETEELPPLFRQYAHEYFQAILEL